MRVIGLRCTAPEAGTKKRCKVESLFVLKAIRIDTFNGYGVGGRYSNIVMDH